MTPEGTQTVARGGEGPSAETWVLWAAAVPATAAGLRGARVALAEALLRAGWGADAGRVLLVAGDAMSRALAGRGDGAGTVEVAFVVSACGARVRLGGRGPGRETAYPALVDRIQYRPVEGGTRVLMSFRRAGVTRRGARPRR
jgi:hypothetical protein